MAFTSVAMAGDPLDSQGDLAFLMSDPDGDQIITIDEFTYGTDPFNTDSDNDGLPDWWELEYSPWLNPDPNALMDATDPKDAHDDFDYDPSSNGSGYNVGEQDATFKAVQKLKGGQLVAWPSNPDVLFTQPVFNEQGPHYDNYEEYYRPYTDVDAGNVIRYMNTNPTKPDSDGDGILDPDDFEPLGWKNDGTSPGGNDLFNINTNNNLDNLDIETEDNSAIIEPYEPPEPNEDFEIFVEQSNVESQSSSEDSKSHLKDIDNDGI